MRSRTFLLVLFSAIAPSLVRAADLTVVVKGFHSGKGGVAFSVFSQEDGYPVDDKKAAVTRYVRKIEGTEEDYSVTTVFKNLKPGLTAVAVFHDEDGDEKLTTNFLGIPTESTGASRDARGSFGPPSFKDAAFDLQKNQTIEIHL